MDSLIDLTIGWAVSQIRDEWQYQQQALECHLTAIRDLEQTINDHRQAVESKIVSVEQSAKSITKTTNTVLNTILASNGVADHNLPAWDKDDFKPHHIRDLLREVRGAPQPILSPVLSSAGTVPQQDPKESRSPVLKGPIQQEVVLQASTSSATDRTSVQFQLARHTFYATGD